MRKDEPLFMHLGMKALAYSVEKYRIFLQKIAKEKDHMSRQHQN